MGRIAIIYSHKDEIWKDRLQKHLKVSGVDDIEVWNETRIQTGSDWFEEIRNVLTNANVIILLISADFLTSAFISEVAIPLLLRELEKKDDLLVIPMVVKPCLWNLLPWLMGLQVFPKSGKPLSGMSRLGGDKELTFLVLKINDFIQGMHKTAPGVPITAGKKQRTVLLTDLPKRRIELLGREEDLIYLESHLKKTKQALLVNGLGGIGKTEVCKRFFMDHYREYAFAGWIDFVSSIKESLVAAIDPEQVSNIQATDTADERFQKIKTFFKKVEGDTLLVLDNIENPDDPDLDFLTALRENIKIIANSRQIIAGFEVYSLEFPTGESCRALFYHYYKGEKDDEAVDKLVSLCGRHPLTVELLAKTAQNAAMPIKTLYKLLEEKGFNLNGEIRDRVEIFRHDKTEKKQFFDHLLTIFDWSKVTDEERNILMNLSVLPSIYIPVSLISEWLKLETNEDINSLVRKGWLKQDKLNVLMHKVIQEVIRYKASPNVEKCKNLILSLTGKLHFDFADNLFDKEEFIIFAESLLQHIDEKNNDLAALANNLSRICQALGK
ncbi:MAG TPA: toll/interleukin-1 receptor domain-containing protein [Candidatus Kapabacteria bacterium]|nr:toll/interleukin-1 receptor domain-containing protein [Candidatus Kapabacteria bacterium]